MKLSKSIIQVCKDTREHKEIDCQLHTLAFELVRLGIIQFNTESKTYYIDKDKINASTAGNS